MNTKISDAVEAISARFRSGNSVPVERASVTREEWESLISALHHQPAALSEVSGNSGELGGEQEALDIDDVRELFEEWAKGRDLTPNTWGSTSYENVSVDNDWLIWIAAWKALAATGKQQGGEVQGDALATLQQDYANLLAAFDRQVAAAEKIAATALEQDDRIEELEEALAARQPVEMSPDFTDTARAAIAWVLWHHQGGSSPVGQPLRFALGMGQHDRMNDQQIAEAKRFAAWAGASSEGFHRRDPAQGIDLGPIATRKLAELAAQGYVTNGVAIFNPATGQRGLVDNLGFVGWMGGKRAAGAGVDR